MAGAKRTTSEILTLVRSSGGTGDTSNSCAAEGLQVTSVPVRRFEAASGLVRAGYADDRCRPATSTRAAMTAELHRIVTTGAADVVYFHLVRMAQDRVEDAPYAQVLDMCDALSVQYRERARSAIPRRDCWRTVDRAESRRLAAWEESIVRSSMPSASFPTRTPQASRSVGRPA